MKVNWIGIEAELAQFHTIAEKGWANRVRRAIEEKRLEAFNAVTPLGFIPSGTDFKRGCVMFTIIDRKSGCFYGQAAALKEQTAFNYSSKMRTFLMQQGLIAGGITLIERLLGTEWQALNLDNPVIARLYGLLEPYKELG